MRNAILGAVPKSPEAALTEHSQRGYIRMSPLSHEPNPQLSPLPSTATTGLQSHSSQLHKPSSSSGSPELYVAPMASETASHPGTGPVVHKACSV